MITEIFRLDTGKRFAHSSTGRWSWVLEVMQEEFPHWWTDDVDTVELDTGDQILTVGGEAKALLRYRVGWDTLHDSPTRLGTVRRAGDALPRNAGHADQDVRSAS